MPIDLTVVDAFTDRPFTGNPAAVCLLESEADASWMQRVAREMNLSETAFLVRRPTGDGFDLRWFTPALEVDLCGHATLASAHVLFSDGHAGNTKDLQFHCLSGVLVARRDGDDICLDFPSEPAEAADAPDVLLDALGLDPDAARFVGRNRLDWLVEVKDAAAVRAVAPDMASLRSMPARGAMVTAGADDDTPPGHDFVSRYFAPAFGVDEDPVTGSAHCALGPYWATKLGRSGVTGFQASARGGSVGVIDQGDRVELIGRAVTMLRSRLLV